jgi:DNA repair protein SbcC/Rad50
MKLKNIFSPLINAFSSSSLNSNNPKNRIRAILEELEPGNPELTNIAIKDVDTEVKICAIHRLTSLDDIQKVIMKLNDDNAKKIAYQHFAKMLSGEIFPIPDLKEREQVINGTLPNKTIEYIALSAKESQLRIQAIHKVNRDALLGDIALNDNNSQVKISAAGQIGKKSTLERVCKKSRSKDKRVYKTCKEKLDGIIDDEERPQRINREILELCEQLEKIYKRNLLLQEENSINNLQKKWQEYKNFTNEETQQRYQTIIDKIHVGLKQLKQQQLDELQTRENLQQIIHNLSIEAEELLLGKENNNIEIIDSKLKTIELYKKSWNEQVVQITTKKNKDIIEQYKNILILIEQAEEQKENLSSIELLKQYITRAEQLLSSHHFVGDKLIKSLEKNFSHEFQKSDQSNAQANECKIQFKEKLKLLQERIDKQQKEYQQLIQTSDKLVSEIGNKLEQGETDEALQLKKQYHNLIDKSAVISTKDKENMLQKVRTSDNQLNQLTSWKNWANNRERENLCQQADDLLQKIKTSDENITAVYNQYGDRVKELRSQWKKLTGRSPDQLWEQFNNSCNLCFDLFKPHFEQQEAIRSNNLALKEAICKQLEDYIQYMGWPSSTHPDENESKAADTDWIQVNKILRQAKTEWRTIGPTDKKQSQKVYNKYIKLVDSINKELKKIWIINQKKYQQLIDQVFALHKIMDKDLNKAINEAKSLQAQWNQLGPVQHFQRKTLWKNFRKGCDVIFNKRDEIKTELDHKNGTIILEKTGLCENLEALNKQNLSIADLNNAFTDIKSTWTQINEKTPAKHKTIDQRFEKAKLSFKQKIKLLQKQEQQQQSELLKQKAQLCSDIENNKKASSDEDWESLAKLKNNALEKQIEARFIQAGKLSEQSDSQELLEELLETSYTQKEQLCLNLEVLTDQESPDEESQKRLEFQIQQMNGNAVNLPKTVQETIIQWYLLPDFEQHSSLKERFLKIVN